MKRCITLLLIVIASMAVSFNAEAQESTRGSIPNPLLKPSQSGTVAVLKGRWTDYAGKGKYLLVHFWMPWDEACNEDAFIKDVQRKYGPKGLTFLGVPIGEVIDMSMEAIQNRGISYPNLLDVDGEPSERFVLGDLPCLVLLKPNGEVLFLGTWGEETETTLTALLSETFK